MSKVTIRHVAAAAGVAVKTVSRVMNGEPNVTQDLQDRVNKAVDALGYVPSMAARRMGGSRSYLLVALNDRENTINNWRSGRGNDWIDQMLHGAMLTCEAHGYRMLFELVEAGSPDLDRKVVAILSALQPDGIILTPPHSQNLALVEMLTRRNVPVVRMGVAGEGVGFGVFMDDRAAAAEATRHLLQLGHRRIGFIAGSPRFEASRQRLDGYRDALTEAGVTIDEDLIAPGDFTFESGVAAAGTLLARDDRPTAILASNDEMALATLHVASRLRIRVPDLSLVSFDDTPGVRLSVPGLTSIRQPISEMAAKAAALLIGVSRTGEGAPSDHLLPFALEVRGSTAPLT
ncbi:LacI family DNA-binding transcriptional regulator [Brevundimonas subvibrioides]|uniref:Transcriptional regulator, LacI family n=1 Tax=Brevundimonas subvibrioides (strain ATCC 15264 / DSM 4735 / LMG 14903 / NBRC 16000 / CB 81) TaxID=633149 RepID=D9QHA6_BRESC|nr:LacI family DNA-binding transcriptional regulator [Brevundimonas subvibrioides]ADL01072.1 transcriptional regulator, LacI family [Brevundimonas subvibrioides ATCC 15264]